MARSPKRIGSKVRGVGVSLSCYVGGTIGFDGLLVITPDGRVRFQSGIGNLGTESVIDVHRAGAEVLGVPWEKVRRRVGQHVEASSVDLCVRRQPDDSRDDPGRPRRRPWMPGKNSRKSPPRVWAASPRTTTVANERVFRRGAARA